jgi:uncharacterized membrane protein YqgA involved in biofilm formation
MPFIQITVLVITIIYVVCFSVFLYLNHTVLKPQITSAVILPFIGYGVLMLLAIIFSSWGINEEKRKVQIAGMMLVVIVPVIYFTIMMYARNNISGGFQKVTSSLIFLYISWAFLGLIAILESINYWAI